MVDTTMKVFPSLHDFFRLSLFFVFFGVLGIFLRVMSPTAVSAALHDPVNRQVTVSATVRSQSPPPAPILIRPENSARLSSGLVEFRWRAVTGHPTAIDRYEISVNGQRIFTLPLTNSENDQYTLRLEDGEYRLQLKSPARLADGNYTWKVRVVDVSDNGTDSATWQFTVDSSPPPIVVTNIYGQETSISATDPSTVPAEPVQVPSNQPFIFGRTEGGAEVQLVVRRADGSETHYKMTATTDGGFLFYLPVLSAHEIVNLTITAIDQSGNSRVLHGLRIQYVPRRVVVPLPEVIPDQPEVIIPIPIIPGITEPTPPPLIPSPTPTPSLQPIAPVDPDGTQRPETPTFQEPIQPIGGWRWVLLFLLFGYTVWVFLWTGNRWYQYPAWLMQILRWWLLLPEGESRLTTPSGLEIPWTPIHFEWLEAGQKLKRVRVWSSPSGAWKLPQHLPQQVVVSVQHPSWQWLPVPSVERVASGFVPIQHQALNFSGLQSAGAETILSHQQKLWMWAGREVRVSDSHWRWTFRWWPRIWLALMLLVAGWVAYSIPILESFLWLAIVISMMIRDVQSGLSGRWQAWQEKES